MFYLGFDLDTFKRVALIQSLLVVVAIIFDYMERRKTPIFPGCIIYPLLGILFVFGFIITIIKIQHFILKMCFLNFFKYFKFLVLDFLLFSFCSLLDF